MLRTNTCITSRMASINVTSKGLCVARASAGGLAILALTSSTARGTSRIVPHCNRVTSTYCDVDVIVTEHGVADIRATTLQERSELIAAIAAPDHRGLLLRAGGK